MPSQTLASGPGDCCVKGFKHTGNPTGAITTLAGVNTYVSEPIESAPRSKKVIIFFSDIYSSVFLNNQLLQDYFAGQGVLQLPCSDRIRV